MRDQVTCIKHSLPVKRSALLTLVIMLLWHMFATAQDAPTPVSDKPFELLALTTEFWKVFRETSARMEPSRAVWSSPV
jgi:hypothetical protein